jgi:hypothetical protein
MGGGSSSPKYLDETRVYSNDKAKEGFENINNFIFNYYYFRIILIIIILLIIILIYYYKKRYKD